MSQLAEKIVEMEFQENADGDERILFDNKDLEFISKHDPYNRVLLVEDDYGQFQILKEILTEINHEVEIDWAPEGGMALAQIAQAQEREDEREYDLVILDVFLRNNSRGTDILPLLVNTLPKLKVILISGYSRAEIKREEPLINYGLNFIQKPIDISKFYRIAKPILSE